MGKHKKSVFRLLWSEACGAFILGLHLLAHTTFPKPHRTQKKKPYNIVVNGANR